MNEASFASLCPALLARKGGAKPAMRPQLGVIPANQPDGLEDLGWNDMGEDDLPVETNTASMAATGAAVIPINPAAAAAAVEAGDETQHMIADQFDNLADRLAQPAARKMAIGAAMPIAKPASAGKRGKRAAFTLRLDTERHLKLRLAATIQNCSAQQLVTEALDMLLDEFEDLDTLAAKLSRN